MFPPKKTDLANSDSIHNGIGIVLLIMLLVDKQVTDIQSVVVCHFFIPAFLYGDEVRYENSINFFREATGITLSKMYCSILHPTLLIML